MKIINAKIVDKDFNLVTGDIEIDEGKILQVSDKISYKSDELVLDCEKSFTVVPGFVDVHIHGCVGRDTGDGQRESIEDMANYLISKGVTTFCPTTMTSSIDDIKKNILVVKEYMDKPGEGATVAGVNMEGPFFSKAKKGAQNGSFLLDPNWEVFHKLQEECGNIIKIADIAPEENGGMEFAKKVSKDCVVSIAHSNATYDQAIESFENGITHATHLFNGMTGMSHRQPGIVGAIFEDERVTAEMICDGLHIHPSVVKTVFNLMGDRICVISDALMMAGMEEGTETEMAGQHVSVKNNIAVLDNGTIAGSITNLHDELKNLVSWGIPLEKAVKAMTYTPAKQLKMEKEIGSIEVGKKADLVILDNELNIVAVYHN